jgi:hypothetical protein
MTRPSRLGSEFGSLLERDPSDDGLQPGIHPGYGLLGR